MATQKELFAIALTDTAKSIAASGLEKAPELVSQYFDLGFDSGGSDPIVDGDLIRFNGLTAAEVTAIITALQQISNYFNNSAVTTADYAASFNNVRYAVYS